MNDHREIRSLNSRFSEWLFPGVRRSKRKKRMRNMLLVLLTTAAIVVFLFVEINHLKKTRHAASENAAAATVNP